MRERLASSSAMPPADCDTWGKAEDEAAQVGRGRLARCTEIAICKDFNRWLALTLALRFLFLGRLPPGSH